MARLNAAQVKEYGKRILEDIEKATAAARADGQNFMALAADDVAAKLKREAAPFISSQAWSKGAPPGGSILLRVFIFNPEPEPMRVYAHVWVGTGNVDPVVGTFLLNVDPRFPRLTQPEHPGLVQGTPPSFPFPVQPNTSVLDFHLKVPSPIEETVYLGNLCLMRLGLMDPGEYLDRSVFPFLVRTTPP